MRVLVIDSSELVARGIVGALSGVGWEACTTTYDHVLAQDAHSLLSGCGLVIVGIDDPRGRLVIERVSATSAVIALVESAEPGSYREALRLGAMNAVARTDHTQRLLSVARAVLDDEALLPVSVLKELALRVREHQSAASVLTETDRDVLGHLAEGITVAALAERLNRSERDCYRILTELYRRMRVSGRAQALVRAASWGVIS